MLAVGDGSTRIQLLAPLSPSSTIAKFIDTKGPGIQQMAYTVTDIDAVSATLRVVRVSSRIPSDSSKPRTVWLSADCETPSRAAARVKLPSRTTARNAAMSSSPVRAIQKLCLSVHADPMR